MAEVKKALKEPPYFAVISLNPNIYLIWVRALKNYFGAKGCSNKESFIMASQKLQGYPNIGLVATKGRELFRARLES